MLKTINITEILNKSIACLSVKVSYYQKTLLLIRSEWTTLPILSICEKIDCVGYMNKKQLIFFEDLFL